MSFLNIRQDNTQWNNLINAINNGGGGGGGGGVAIVHNERVFGKILDDTDNSNFAGYGYADLTYYSDHTVKVIFHAKITSSSRTYSTFRSGLNAQLLHELNTDLPLITPVVDNCDIMLYNSSGYIDYSHMEYGYITEIGVDSPYHWKVARYYTNTGSIGGYPSGTWGDSSGKILRGTVYGTWEEGE